MSQQLSPELSETLLALSPTLQPWRIECPEQRRGANETSNLRPRAASRSISLQLSKGHRYALPVVFHGGLVPFLVPWEAWTTPIPISRNNTNRCTQCAEPCWHSYSRTCLLPKMSSSAGALFNCRCADQENSVTPTCVHVAVQVWQKESSLSWLVWLLSRFDSMYPCLLSVFPPPRCQTPYSQVGVCLVLGLPKWHLVPLRGKLES